MTSNYKYPPLQGEVTRIAEVHEMVGSALRWLALVTVHAAPPPGA